MPKLNEEQRQSINERRAIHQRIMDSFKDRQYMRQSCMFCNWASNALTLDEAIELNREHERSHPEYEEWQAAYIGHSEIVDSIHDHDCEMVLCSCRCGCQQGPYCGIIGGKLCATCVIRQGRGDSEHGEKEASKIS